MAANDDVRTVCDLVSRTANVTSYSDSMTRSRGSSRTHHFASIHVDEDSAGVQQMLRRQKHRQ